MPSRGKTTALLLACAALLVAGVAALAVGEPDPKGPGTGGSTGEPVALSETPEVAERTLTLERLETPPHTRPVVWVRRGERVELRTRPRGGELVEAVGRRTEFGSPSVFGVVRSERNWAAVSTASMPNGRLAWVRFRPERMKAGWTETAVEVDLSERRAELIERGRVVRSFLVTIGAPGSTTPTGRFAVTDTFRGGLDPAYGCCALALSATQPLLPSGWLGGNRIAIHGTPGPLGVAASHGCVRAADRDVSALVRRVELGAPVTIRP